MPSNTQTWSILLIFKTLHTYTQPTGHTIRKSTHFVWRYSIGMTQHISAPAIVSISSLPVYQLLE